MFLFWGFFPPLRAWRQGLCASICKMGIKFPNRLSKSKAAHFKVVGSAEIHTKWRRWGERKKLCSHSAVQTHLNSSRSSLESVCSGVVLQLQCVCVCGFDGRQEAGCGALISSVQTTTCLRPRDAVLSPAKDGIRAVKGIVGTLFPASVFVFFFCLEEAALCTCLPSVCALHP